jgi:hypothetical protein
MNRSKALALLSECERKEGDRLHDALLRGRHYNEQDLGMLRSAEAAYLPAVNPKARIKWGTEFIEAIDDSLDLNAESDRRTLFHVTIADREHILHDAAGHALLKAIKRKLSGVLAGLSYVGMIEPGYYNAIYDDAGEVIRDVVSWHAHVVVWGKSRQQLRRLFETRSPKLAPVAPHMDAIRIKKVPRKRQGRVLCYVVKSPRREYSVGKRLHPKPGKSPYKHNGRPLRQGHRVKLFHMLADIRLDELAMAGGDGSELMQTIKYKALAEYRRKSRLR